VKYKEIPIDDLRGAEQFEIDKPIVVYKQGEILYLCCHGIEGHYLVCGYNKHHYKACRKREKVEPREFWIKDTLANAQELRILMYPEKPLDTSGWICVREMVRD